jgi:predicted DNA repair protein MutK
VADATGALGGVLAWSVNTLASALLGLAIGAVIVVAVHLVGRLRGGRSTASA